MYQQRTITFEITNPALQTQYQKKKKTENIPESDKDLYNKNYKFQKKE